MLRENSPGTAAGKDAPAREERAAPSARRRWIMMAALLLTAVNLRPAITSLGALLEEVRAGLGMSGAVAGLLTAVPGLCFAVFGGLAPWLARRFGLAPVLCGSLAALTAGLAVRPWAAGSAAFVVASVLALGGIAVSNVLLPAVVKRWFPDRVGLFTGLYSMVLALGTAAAAALTIPVSDALHGSWRLGLGSWAVLAAMAVLPWAALLPVRQSRRRAVRVAEGERPAPDEGGPPLRITRSPTAWALGIFFGLQATAAYAIMGWLPQIYRDAGLSPDAAGLLLAVVMGVGVPLALVMPQLAARVEHQGPIVLVLCLCGLGGYAGLWLAPAGGAVAWALLLSVANCAFTLVLALIGLRARTSAGVAQLSAFAQSTGYLVSVPGPLVVGALYGATGGWHAPLALLAALMVAGCAVGLVAGRNRVVEDEM